MKKFLLVLSAIMLSSSFVFGQLIYNPSFEVTDIAMQRYPICISGYCTPTDQIRYCLYDSSNYLHHGWYSATSGTPDYFNVHATSNSVKVPKNDFDYLYANDGQGYVGFICDDSIKPDGVNRYIWKEYIEEKLPETLSPGKYKFSFSISKGKHWHTETGHVLKSFGAYFSSSRITANMMGDLSSYFTADVPHVISTEYLTQTAIEEGHTNAGYNGWQQVSGNLTIPEGTTADYIIFGHFGSIHDDVMEDATHHTTDAAIHTYYFVDNLNLQSCPTMDFNYLIKQSDIIESGKVCYDIEVWPKGWKSYMTNVKIKVTLAGYSGTSAEFVNHWTELIPSQHFIATICFDYPEPKPADSKLSFYVEIAPSDQSYDSFCKDSIRADYKKPCTCDMAAFEVNIDTVPNPTNECCYSLSVTRTDQSDCDFVKVRGLDLKFKNEDSFLKFKSLPNTTTPYNAGDPPGIYFYSESTIFGYILSYIKYDYIDANTIGVVDLDFNEPNQKVHIVDFCFPDSENYQSIGFESLTLVNDQPYPSCTLPLSPVSCGTCDCSTITDFSVTDNPFSPCCKLIQFSLPYANCQAQSIKVTSGLLPDSNIVIPNADWTMNGSTYTAMLCLPPSFNNRSTLINIEFYDTNNVLICSKSTSVTVQNCISILPCDCSAITDFSVIDNPLNPCCKLIQFSLPNANCQAQSIKVTSGLNILIPKADWTLNGSTYTATLCLPSSFNNRSTLINVEFYDTNNVLICSKSTSVTVQNCISTVPCEEALGISCSCNTIVQPVPPNLTCCNFNIYFNMPLHCNIYSVKTYRNTGSSWVLYGNYSNNGLPVQFPMNIIGICYSLDITLLQLLRVEFYDQLGNLLFIKIVTMQNGNCGFLKSAPGNQEYNIDAQNAGFLIRNYSIAPNPTSDKITVTFNLSEPTPLKLEIFNSLGEIVYTSVLSGAVNVETSTEINTSNLIPGKYQVKLSAETDFKTIPLTIIR